MSDTIFLLYFSFVPPLFLSFFQEGPKILSRSHHSCNAQHFQVYRFCESFIVAIRLSHGLDIANPCFTCDDSYLTVYQKKETWQVLLENVVSLIYTLHHILKTMFDLTNCTFKQHHGSSLRLPFLKQLFRWVYNTKDHSMGFPCSFAFRLIRPECYVLFLRHISHLLWQHIERLFSITKLWKWATFLICYLLSPQSLTPQKLCYKRLIPVLQSLPFDTAYKWSTNNLSW